MGFGEFTVGDTAQVQPCAVPQSGEVTGDVQSLLTAGAVAIAKPQPQVYGRRAFVMAQASSLSLL